MDNNDYSERNYETKYEMSKYYLPKYEELIQIEEHPENCPNIDISIRKDIIDQSSFDYLKMISKDNLMKNQIEELEKKNKDCKEEVKMFNSQESNEDLMFLFDKYNEFNTEINSIINYIQFITTNININENNKQIKLVNFFKTFSMNFQKMLKSYSERSFQNQLMVSLKDNFIRFFETRYSIIIKYAFENYNLNKYLDENEIKLQYEQNN